MAKPALESVVLSWGMVFVKLAQLFHPGCGTRKIQLWLTETCRVMKLSAGSVNLFEFASPI